MEDQRQEDTGVPSYEDNLAEGNPNDWVQLANVDEFASDVQPEEVTPATQAPSVLTDEGNEGGVEYGTDWEAEAKKFQSMYDKTKSEYDALSSDSASLDQMRELKNVLEQRPDIVEAIRGKLEGNAEASGRGDSGQLDESSFDPWEAYYKPESESYKMRLAQERALVDEAVGGHMAELQGQVAMQNLRNELKSKYNMESDEEIGKFIEFATNPRDELPIDLLIDVYNKHYGKGAEMPSSENMEATRQAQAMPRPAGILQGGEPPRKSENDAAWDRILNASNSGRIP
tara:strand:+ start:759 stop:1616 length:858 start_codon:yes stop_codon:yes gene_type:complete